MEQIHRYARTLPQTPEWNKISGIIDSMVIELINTEKPTDVILHAAQEQVRQITSGRPKAEV
jgi:hypothetical protein